MDRPGAFPEDLPDDDGVSDSSEGDAEVSLELKALGKGRRLPKSWSE